MERYKDIISGGFVFAAALVLFVMTFFMRRLTVLSVGPEFIPRIVFGMMMVLGLLIAAEGVKKCRAGRKSEVFAEKECRTARPQNKTAAVTLLLIMVYIASLRQIGFLITTVVYLFLQITVLAPKEKRRPVQFLIIATVCSSVIYYLFLNVFQLLLPAGILG